MRQIENKVCRIGDKFFRANDFTIHQSRLCPLFVFVLLTMLRNSSQEPITSTSRSAITKTEPTFKIIAKQAAQSKALDRTVRLPALLQITLMIVFPAPELWREFNLRYHRPPKTPA